MGTIVNTRDFAREHISSLFLEKFAFFARKQCKFR